MTAPHRKVPMVTRRVVPLAVAVFVVALAGGWSLSQSELLARTAAEREPAADISEAAAPVGPTGSDHPAPGGPSVAPLSSVPTVTFPRPIVTGPRRVAIQVGHWQTENVPDELRRIETATGTSWDGITEVEVDLDIASRIRALLEAKGIVVDVLPTTIPVGYVADAFLALHCDGDGVGFRSGYKLAHGSRRGLYEEDLLRAVSDAYGAATGLRYDATGITNNMRNYYAFVWSRYLHSVAPHAPAAIIELGFLSNAGDRALLVDSPDVVAGGVAAGIEAFLAAHPRDQLFAQDLVLQPFGLPRPSPIRP